MSEAPITIVSGLPRSGTSLMMQMLAAGGLPPCTDGTRVADASNPRGYFEDDRVKRLRMDKSWLWEARGRALKVIHLLLPELPTTAGLTFDVVFLRRRMEEVLASQRTMLARGGAAPTTVDPARLAAVFTAQLARTDEFLAAHAGVFRVLDVAHHALLADPAGVAARVNGFLGGGLDAGRMTATVDPALWRQRGGGV